MLYLEVTHRCNLRCIACYTKAGAEKPDALTLDERISVVRQARDMGAQAVSLSGSGEPLLYRDLFPLIDFIRSLGMRVFMFTNGTLVTREAAEFLMSRRVAVYVKLYSLDPGVFDRMAGRPDAYEWVEHSYTVAGTPKSVRIPSGLKHLLDVRRPDEPNPLVRVETLITRINEATIPDVVRLAADLGMPLELETPVLAGRAVENYREVAMDAVAYRRLYEALVGILGEAYFEELRKRPCYVERGPVVWTNGDIGFCSSRAARIGNVRSAPLRELFVQAQKAKRAEDGAIRRLCAPSRYFRTCPSRQYHEAKCGIPCEY